jgi:LacI family transcriptional regulator
LELVDADAEPTAVCCTNDVVAMRVMQDVLLSGRDVPEHLSIVGFDDVPMAAHPRLALTTVHSDAEDTGEIVIDMLLRAVAESRHANERVTLPASLVIRSSTGPVGGAALTRPVNRKRSAARTSVAEAASPNTGASRS